MMEPNNLFEGNKLIDQYNKLNMEQLTHPHPLTVSQLLKPRFEVINIYPGCPFEIGQTLELTPSAEKDKPFYWDGKTHLQYSELQKYQHLFREMFWYEGHDMKDMPLYVGLDPHMNNGGKYYRVSHYGYYEDIHSPFRKEAYKADVYVYIQELNRKVHIRYVMPATKEQFENQHRL